MQGYEPGAECAECKGKCCKDKGCSLAPEDLLLALFQKCNEQSVDCATPDEQELVGIQAMATEELRERVVALLTEPQGLYTIDYFSRPDGPCFYLRMRHKCYTFIGVDAMGECVALTKDGCSLSPERRPKGGRFLESRPNRACEQHYTQEMMYEDWKPYQEVLRSIWKEYYPKMKEDGTFDRCDDAYFAWMKEQREQGG